MKMVRHLQWKFVGLNFGGCKRRNVKLLNFIKACTLIILLKLTYSLSCKSVYIIFTVVFGFVDLLCLGIIVYNFTVKVGKQFFFPH